MPQQALQTIDTLHKAGFEAYAVGGSVRDLLMGRPTKGWDFTTNAIPEQILKLFPDSFYDNQFGTVGIKVYKKGTDNAHREPEDIFEITTYRSENGYSDHRHPDTIAWGKTLEEDLSRRDFTINAIAYDGRHIVDPYEGKKDVQAKLVRAVGAPADRFKEDALRMLRCLRIAAELGFTIEERTFAAIGEYAILIKEISAERVHDELLRLLSSPYASDAILVMKNAGLLSHILPELVAAFTTQQKSPKRHHIYDVGTHSVMALKHTPSTDPIVRLAALLHDIGKPPTQREDTDGVITFFNHEVVGTKIVKDIARRLRMSNKQTDRLATLVRWHQFSVDERQTDSALRRFIRRVGKDNLADILAVRIGDRLGGGARETSWRLELFKKRLAEVQKQPFTVADLAVDGHDVMREFSCKPGPLIGKVLTQIFTEVEEGKRVNQREVLLARLHELNIMNVFSSVTPTVAKG